MASDHATPDTMSRVTADPSSVEAILARLGVRPARLGRTKLVCIDGPAGSGKTTMAAGVVNALADRGVDVAALHMDDLFEGWQGLSRPDFETRLLGQVFKPLARGQATRWQRYDWHAERFAEWHQLDPSDVLVVEGCGSGALAYARYRSVLAFVEAGRETRLRRGIARDGADVEADWLAWMDREDRNFIDNATRDNADLVFRTD